MGRRRSAWRSLSPVRRRVLGYSIVWGAICFAAGILFTYLSLPDALNQLQVPLWKLASWTWLNAHGVGIAGQQVGGVSMMFQDVTFISENPELHLLRTVPPLFVLLTVLLVIVSIGGVAEEKHILEDGVAAVIGYLLAGLATVILSGASPSVGLILGLVAVLGGALYVGAVVASRLPVPVFAVTGFSGLVGIGLFVVFAGAVVSSVVVPMGKTAIIGGVIGIAAVWTATNLGRRR